MLKNKLNILIVAVLISSCQEINISKEVDYTLLLDSLVQNQKSFLKDIDTTLVNECLYKSAERIRLFDLDNLDVFQKDWIHHDKLAYQKIEKNFMHFNSQIDSLLKELTISKNQIVALKEDLIHRHLNKTQFSLYISEEQKMLGKLTILGDKLKSNFTTNLAHFDSLEYKLHGIFIQLNAIHIQNGNFIKN